MDRVRRDSQPIRALNKHEDPLPQNVPDDGLPLLASPPPRYVLPLQ